MWRNLVCVYPHHRNDENLIFNSQRRSLSHRVFAIFDQCLRQRWAFAEISKLIVGNILMSAREENHRWMTSDRKVNWKCSSFWFRVLERTGGDCLDAIVVTDLLIDPKLVVRLITEYINHVLAALGRRVFGDRLHPPDAALNNRSFRFRHLQPQIPGNAIT